MTQENGMKSDQDQDDQECRLRSMIAGYTVVAFDRYEIHPNGSVFPADALKRLQQHTFEIRM